MQSNADDVYQFTSQSGTSCPDRPSKPLTRDQVLFITRMVFSEMDELVCTVSDNQEESEKLLQEALSSRDPCKNFDYSDDLSLVSAQGDAMVDAWYYMLNCAAKMGLNLSSIFNLVHKANMSKKDPVSGKFLKRDDGKIIKPKGWTSPDIDSEVKRQNREGSWNNASLPTETLSAAAEVKVKEKGKTNH